MKSRDIIDKKMHYVKQAKEVIFLFLKKNIFVKNDNRYYETPEKWLSQEYNSQKGQKSQGQ